ncbi:hypothetical protein IJ182_01175 [bacterium]|nr:hypothetical protein [bacterium]
MKVAAINNGFNFGRAIVVQNSKPENNTNQELLNVLNGQNSKVYQKKEARQLRVFFRQILGDYNSKSEEVILRTTEDGDSVLLSGKDAADVKNTEEQKQHTRKLIWKNPNLTRTKKLRLVKKTYLEEGKVLNSKIEDGKEGRAKTKLYIESSPANGKISHIDYESMNIEYTMIKNGHVMTKDEFENSDKHSRCLSSVSYENRSFDLMG